MLWRNHQSWRKIRSRNSLTHLNTCNPGGFWNKTFEIVFVERCVELVDGCWFGVLFSARLLCESCWKQCSVSGFCFVLFCSSFSLSQCLKTKTSKFLSVFCRGQLSLPVIFHFHAKTLRGKNEIHLFVQRLNLSAATVMGSLDRNGAWGLCKAQPAAASALYQQRAALAAWTGLLRASSLLHLRPRPSGGRRGKSKLDPGMINVWLGGRKDGLSPQGAAGVVLPGVDCVLPGDSWETESPGGREKNGKWVCTVTDNFLSNKDILWTVSFFY